MSTDSPLPTAASAAAVKATELATTSQNGENSLRHNGAYMQFDESNISDNMTIRKRNVPTADASSGSTATAMTTAASTSSFNKNGTEAMSIDASNTFTTANSSIATSSTSYAFAGSALGTEKITTTPISNFTTTTSSTTSTTTTTNNSTTNSGTGNSTDNTNANNNANTNTTSSNNEDKQDDSLYECNICLDTAKDAVVSMCGHLFCWPCLHQWLETRPNRMLCPVCKAAISKDKVIPLYGRNCSKQEDPRNKVPPRPAGQRTEPEPQHGFQGFGFGDGFHMSFGIGAFPFGYFASSFNIGEPRPAPANRGTTQYEDEQQLSKLFLYLAFLCIAWLMFA